MLKLRPLISESWINSIAKVFKLSPGHYPKRVGPEIMLIKDPIQLGIYLYDRTPQIDDHDEFLAVYKQYKHLRDNGKINQQAFDDLKMKMTCGGWKHNWEKQFNTRLAYILKRKAAQTAEKK